MDITYLYLKSLHVIFMVCWFAGLFYIVRLFIYHVEAAEKPEAARKAVQDQLAIMEERLWKAITVPAMLLTLIFGIWMLIKQPALMKEPWMHLKLTLVFLLVGYHHMCGAIRKKLLKGTCRMTSKTLRIINEVPTVLLFAIVYSVILRNLKLVGWGMVGFLLFIGLTTVFAVFVNISRKK